MSNPSPRDSAALTQQLSVLGDKLTDAQAALRHARDAEREGAGLHALIELDIEELAALRATSAQRADEVAALEAAREVLMHRLDRAESAEREELRASLIARAAENDAARTAVQRRIKAVLA